MAAGSSTATPGNAAPIASRKSAPTPASASTTLARVTRTLYTTRSRVSACQLIVTGTVPTITLPSRKARSATELAEKKCTTHSPLPTPAARSAPAARCAMSSTSARLYEVASMLLSGWMA